MNRLIISIATLLIAGVIGSVPVEGNVPVFGADATLNTGQPSKLVQAPAYVKEAQVDDAYHVRYSHAIDNVLDLFGKDSPAYTGSFLDTYASLRSESTFNCGTPYLDWSGAFHEALETGLPKEVIREIVDRFPGDARFTLRWAHPW